MPNISITMTNATTGLTSSGNGSITDPEVIGHVTAVLNHLQARASEPAPAEQTRASGQPAPAPETE